MGKEGAGALAEALVKNKTLKQLGLGYNEIYVPGAQALAEMLSVNNSLTQLNLGPTFLYQLP